MNDTWMIIFYILLAAMIVSYAILMNYKKGGDDFMKSGDQRDKKSDTKASSSIKQ